MPPWTFCNTRVLAGKMGSSLSNKCRCGPPVEMKRIVTVLLPALNSDKGSNVANPLVGSEKTKLGDTVSQRTQFEF